MRRSSIRLAAIASSGISVGLWLLMSQHRQLQALKSELAVFSSPGAQAQSGSKEDATSKNAKMRDRSSRLHGSPEAQARIVEEVGHLMESLSPSIRGKTFDEVSSDSRSPELERLRDLFAVMDGESFSRLMESHEDIPCAKSHMMFYHELFVRLNPEQALERALAMPEVDERRRGEIFVSFSSWCRASPTAAYHWYQDRVQKGDPVAGMEGIGVSMIPLDAKLNPERAVQRVLELARRPGVTTSSYPLNTVYSAPETIGQRIALLAAFRSAAERLDAPPEAAKLRTAAVEDMTMRLGSEPYAAAIPVVESEFSDQEKLKFAAALVSSPHADATKLHHWAKWLAALDELPVDERHPLMKLVDGTRGGGAYAQEPVWLEELPDSPLKSLATVHYVNLEIERGQPEMAVKWLKKVPVGERRQDLVSKLVDWWKIRDPSRAEALQESERAAGDAAGKH